MKRFSLLLISFTIIFLSGCSPKYDYTIHKPKVVYKKPSREALKKTLAENIGKDYIWAEEGPKAFDCSGLTYYSYGRMNMEIPRVSREQAKVGKRVTVDELQYGDLIFFDTTKNKTGKITHVGLYIGNGRFQHASSTKEGVIISDLNSTYYSKRIITSRRYLPDDTSPNSQTPAPFMLAQTTSTITPLNIENITTTNATPQALQGRHYIQVGTFANQPSTALLRQIKSNGYRYKILKISSNGRILNKVLIGSYPTKTSALRYLDEIRATIIPDAFAVKI